MDTDKSVLHPNEKRYNSWVNSKIYDLVASLTKEEQQQNFGAFFGSQFMER